jgi:sulfide:quinone oxidoreductase
VVVRDSGLAMRGEWLAVDPGTLRASAPGVFAVGDVNEIPLANGMALPKAGLFAESQAKVVASQIIAELRKTPGPAAFDGIGHCFIETGGGEATMVQGHFLASPAPALTVAAPSAQALQQKIDFERSRLLSWFGA